jgi:putative two-component system response regulator
MSVADVYDALTSDRPYRQAWPPQMALQYVREGVESQFDPAVVDALERYLNLTEK